MSRENAIEADLEGSVSPPRDNGEIVFAAPWERRAFGLTIALCRCGACDWEHFRRLLIARIAEEESRSYWSSWAAALEDVLEETGALLRSQTDVLESEFAARPPGHDHHGHDHHGHRH